MMKLTFAEILSGMHKPVDISRLHDALDMLLTEAVANGGTLDPQACWGFMAALGRGRGISEDLEQQAKTFLVRHGAAKDQPVSWPQRQWAILQALLLQKDRPNVMHF